MCIRDRYSIIEALVQMARDAGVAFVLETQVEGIDTDGERARGVVLEGGRYLAADVVLANADLPYVYQNLLPADEETQKFDDMRFSCSTISFFWGVDKVYDPIAPHMLFLADDYRANFESIIDDLTIPANPSLYVHAPARLDPSMAPPGEDTIVAVVPVGHMADDSQEELAHEWATTRDLAREHVFRRLALGQNVQRLGLVDGLGQPVVDQHPAAAAEGQAGALRPVTRVIQMRRLMAAGAQRDGRRPRIADDGAGPVSYTHLDVYKRQATTPAAPRRTTWPPPGRGSARPGPRTVWAHARRWAVRQRRGAGRADHNACLLYTSRCV